ncbi:Protein N-acetyltransferase, RimJ/RimL family [Amycolatopsis marina]|uniref:Protein N-acetyltransferase, RimJ/RimL family n=1 Tax=Amycolatopsis marina TaxID=490629 RepID=A0A1I0VR00_9PSEU|nr:GNAT family N-acetyltransferase [Amycolatopsis marina]SFA78310.1 Protein N-acetyltransferase, RimJ/RimL family [Amycolatopsis marina]
MLRPVYPLQTSRLNLRPFTPSDVADTHAIHSRPDVVRYLYWDVRSEDEVREMVERRMDNVRIEQENDALVLAVERKDTGQLIGDVLLQLNSQANQQGEVGYVFHPDHHGQGFAREAAVEMLRLGFEELQLHRIIGRCDARNTASSGLLKRLGMRHEATLVENEIVKGEWCSEAVYAMLRTEWANSRT